MSKAGLRNLMIAVLAVASLAGAGIAFAHWRVPSNVDGYVLTGDVASYLVEWSCAGTDGDDDLTATELGFAGPAGWERQYSGAAFEVWATDRDVAHTVIEDAVGRGGAGILFRIDNAYPSHYEECEWGIENMGSVPLAAPYAVVRALNPETTFASTVFAEDGVLWIDFRDRVPATQINPLHTKRGSLRIHVEQTAQEDASYAFEIVVCLHNWNEASAAIDDVCGLYEPQEIADGAVIVISESDAENGGD